MEKERIMNISDTYIASTYSRLPIVITKGKGCKVWDSDGREYIDFVSGLAVCNLGHCHPKIVEAIKEQSNRLIHISNLYYTEPQAKLAKLLIENSFADKVFFCNSGAEANEAAIKLARKYTKETGKDGPPEIITMTNSFHGRTMATVTATGQEKFHKGFEPLLSGFTYVPFNDIQAIEKAINRKTCAILVEPIQGEGGVNCPSDNYLKGLRKVCDTYGILLIFDEVQVGLGRTGTLFAYESYDVKPDIMTLAKGLAGGVPIGAMLARKEFAESFSPGSHASTFGGNPIATASALANVKTILENGILQNCMEMGKYFFKKLIQMKWQYPFIKEVRGKGLILGMELESDGGEIVKECMGRGVLINCTMGKTLRFLPPLIVTKEEVDKVIRVLIDIFSGCTSTTYE
ncbi:MAG: aspartate aminotransferase family protein [Thermodesulfobacteriota bacterium]|nr:aspartate aminotransferase family protein [Thermodesulfobacteriota bacterium]